jgi:hypothetical protein
MRPTGRFSSADRFSDSDAKDDSRSRRQGNSGNWRLDSRGLWPLRRSRRDFTASAPRIQYMRAIFVLVLVAAFGFVSPSATSAESSTHAFRTTRTFVFEVGNARRVITMQQPRGVVLLTRLTVTRGISAWADLRIPRGTNARAPGGAAVRVSTSSGCRRRGAVDVCTWPQQWCPMPRATWRIRLRKTGGPPGVIRFDFVVGEPRR